MRSSLAASTVAQYDRMWRGFSDFARSSVLAGLSLAERLERYILVLSDSGRGAQGPAFLSAARFQLLPSGGLPSAARLEAIAAGAYRNARLLARDGSPNREAFTHEMLARVERTMDPSDPVALGDRVLLRLGLDLVGRGGELAALLREDVRFGDGKLRVAVRRSKTRALRAKDVHVFSDPALLSVMRQYLVIRGDTPGPLFLAPGGGAWTTRGISIMLRSRLAQAGIDPANFASHSLRIGGATDLANSGTPALVLAARGGWSPHSDALQRYVRIAH